MGYRSEVRALIYGPADEVDALVMKWKHTETIDLWSNDAFGGHLTEWVDEHGTKFIELHGDDWKWYEDYPNVAAWTRFQDMAEELGLCYEFVRIGEEAHDIETLCGGEDVCSYLGVHRETTCDVAPPGTAEEAAA